MIRETYKGRKLKAVKGKAYGKSRISVNGTECGEWFGTQEDVIKWAKGTIDDVDARPFEGRWAECWYEPGTYELNEIGHIAAPGGVCSCDLCKTEPWNSCRNITAGGVCVCQYCMKSRLADSTEKAEETAEEVADTAEEVQATASEALMGHVVKVTPEMTGLTGARPYLLRVTRVDVVSATSGLVHVHGDKLRLDGTLSREKRPAKAATFMPGWQERLEIVEERTDADVLKAFETKADEIAKTNGWTIARAETVMLRYLRDTSPAEAATVAEALQQRTRQAA